jgi:hypothetical protein
MVALAWMDWYKLTSLKSYLGIGRTIILSSSTRCQKRIIIIPKNQASKRPSKLGYRWVHVKHLAFPSPLCLYIHTNFVGNNQSFVYKMKNIEAHWNGFHHKQS